MLEFTQHNNTTITLLFTKIFFQQHDASQTITKSLHNIQTIKQYQSNPQHSVLLRKCHQRSRHDSVDFGGNSPPQICKGCADIMLLFRQLGYRLFWRIGEDIAYRMHCCRSQRFIYLSRRAYGIRQQQQQEQLCNLTRTSGKQRQSIEFRADRVG